MPYKDPAKHREVQAVYARKRRNSGVPADAEHGKRSTYDRGCRCDPCRAVNNARKAASNRGRTTRRQQVNQAWAEGRGHLLEISHGHSGYIHWGCDCDICVTAYRAYMQAKQQESIADADNQGKPWDDFDIATVRRRDLSCAEAAKILRRTYFSVKSARSRFGRDPK